MRALVSTLHRCLSTPLVLALAAIAVSASLAPAAAESMAKGDDAQLDPRNTVEVRSPDGRTRFVLSTDEGKLRYSVHRGAMTVIEPSALGFVFRETADFGAGFRILGSEQAEQDSRWEQPWGERRVVRDHHRALRVELERSAPPRHRLDIEVRVFNDGLGFRYRVPEQEGLAELHLLDELTEFRLPKPETLDSWWIPGRSWNRYEYLYRSTKLPEMDRAHTPMTLRTPAGLHIAIHEAALIDYAAMVLDQQRDGVLKADLTPWHDGVRVRTRAGFVTPWRTLHIADSASGLIDSDLILNLNAPNALGDVSWVEP
ncbi:MAG: glycoside hydrolase family 97 N-terminal domain-containing protein, partial [Lysobacterales bacterium]